MKRNKFKRALHHLNKKHVVESAPTNSTLGVFNVTPSGVGPVGWTDREFTTDISGNPLPKLQTADFTVGDNPADSTEALDTSGLFAEDGTILTQTPPGDNSYILGPFSSMWYAWGNFTTLGYIRQSDRRMVNLGTITGKLSDWDGSSINSYGSLTLEQALWFRDVDKFGGIDNDPANHNFRARYPGPPSNTPDAFGRYLCVIAAGRDPGGTETRPAPPVNPTEKGEMNSDDNFSMSQYFSKKGKKGDPFGAPDGYDPINDPNEFLPGDPDYNVDKQKEDADNIDKIYDEWKSRYDRNFNQDGSRKTPEEKFDQFRKDNLPKWANDMENWAKKLPWNDPTNPVGEFINKNSWWIEPVVGALAGAAGAKNAYKKPYNIPKTKVNNWKNSTPQRNTSGRDKGKYRENDLELKNSKGDLIGKKYKEDGKWKVKMRPTEKTSLKNKMDWEIDQMQHTDKSFNRYQQTGKNPGLPDLDPLRLFSGKPGSVVAGGKYTGGTVGGKWATSKATGAAVGAGVAAAKGNNKKKVNESFQFNKQRILREIVIPEAKKKYKVKPKVIGHPSNKTLSNQMKDPIPTPAFKKEVPIWSMDQKMRNARESQEKKNEVLEYLGSSSDHWNYMTKAIKEHNKKVIKLNYGGKTKKVTRKEQVDNDYLVFMEDDDGNKSSMLQSKINETQSDEADKELFAKYYEMHPVKKKSLFKEVVKRGVFDYKGKPSKKGYPDEEPAKLDPKTGMHPDYGKKYKYDKLDPQSAESMPVQGNQEIDANIAKNINPEQKKRKMKILSQPNG